MSKYIITCCSTVDLSLDLLNENKIAFISFSYELDNHTYYDDYDKSLSLKKFYEMMEEGHMATTSQISTGRYIEFFEPYLKEGFSIIHLCLSSGITGTYNSACLAANMLNEEYDAKVEIIDSLSASSGYGMLVMRAKDNLDKGLSFKENIEDINKARFNVSHWFFPSELDHLVRGGRVSKSAGFVGNALHIIPILKVDRSGHLIPITKLRGKKKALKYLKEQMEANCFDGHDYKDRVYISHSDDLKSAEELKAMIETSFPKVKEVKLFNIGPVIGAHTGKGTIALFYMGERSEE